MRSSLVLITQEVSMYVHLSYIHTHELAESV